MARMTLARRHREKMLAQQSEHKNASGSTAKGTAYEMMLIRLHADQQRLKQIQSHQSKAKVKAEMLPEYQSWIDGILENGQGAQDEVLMTVLVWHIDVGNYDEALRIAEYALAHDLVMPDQYTRTLATVLLDEISAAMLKQKYDTQEAIEQSLSVMKKTEELTDDRDAPDPAKAKLCKALAFALLARVGDGEITQEMMPDAEEAAKYLERAFDLDERSGVKATLNNLKKRLEPAP